MPPRVMVGVFIDGEVEPGAGPAIISIPFAPGEVDELAARLSPPATVPVVVPAEENLESKRPEKVVPSWLRFRPEDPNREVSFADERSEKGTDARDPLAPTAPPLDVYPVTLESLAEIVCLRLLLSVVELDGSTEPLGTTPFCEACAGI